MTDQTNRVSSEEAAMRKLIGLLAMLLWLPAMALSPVESACCYFSAQNTDVQQPAQKAFITFDPVEKVETFTVQPKFEGNAADFGMVVPTPTRPKLDEMPRDFFKELAVFTILEPMDLSKYKQSRFTQGFRGGAPGMMDKTKRESTVRVLEAGVVGNLDYKIITAERADDLFSWLKDNKYSYAGDEATLDFYIKKKSFFTVMKIDSMQLKKKPDGTYDGEVTPTRFTFASEKLHYPLKITQISVKDKTEALFYVQTAHKVDLSGDFSFQCTWTPMWNQATGFAMPEKLTPDEIAWQKHVQPMLGDLNKKALDMRQKRHLPATLEWAKKITETDLGVLDGSKPYNRQAPEADVKNLKILKGHVLKGQFVTKLRKVFAKDEMNEDLEFVRAKFGDKEDIVEYFSNLPTSPP
jgi:uncharacterized protein DUF2330